MILNALAEYYDILAAENKVAKEGLATVKVAFALVLRRNGEVAGFIPTSVREMRGKKEVEHPQNMIVPEPVTRSSGIAPNFLCDGPAYILGYGKNPNRDMQCFQAAKALHADVLRACEHPVAKAILAYFDSWNPTDIADYSFILSQLTASNTGGNIVFQVDGQYAHRVPELLDCWLRYQNAIVTDIKGTCLITGERDQPLARIHSKIKGVNGAQSAGASLVGFNADAYESHGYEQGENAQISETAMFRYTTALNYLLSDLHCRITMGDLTIVYWAYSPSTAYTDIFSLLANPEGDANEDLNTVFSAIRQGKFIDGSRIDMKTPFYVLGLSPNAARISVRFFLRDSFGQFIKHIKEHYTSLDIVHGPKEKEYVSPYWLLRETVSSKAKTPVVTPLLSGAYLKAILDGSRYPEMFLQTLIMRVRAEQSVNRNKAAAIKAFLIRNQKVNQKEEVMTVALNESSTDKAYVLGRLFAVLERAQTDATPGIQSTIRNRYFGSACATPGVAFPILLKLNQHHISKMAKSPLKQDKDNAYFREREIGQLLNLLKVDESPFPAHLDLTEQGKFIIGYYHQVQDKFTKRKTVDMDTTQTKAAISKEEASNV